jgi:hypothetical protein
LILTKTIKDAEYFERVWNDAKQRLEHVELRGFYPESGADELVVKNGSIHIEQTDDSNYYIGILANGEWLSLSIGSESGRAKVRMILIEAGRDDKVI